MSGPLRILWPICADGAIVVVRRGTGWPELRRVGVWRWVRVGAAWAARRRVEAGALRQAARLLDGAAACLADQTIPQVEERARELRALAGRLRLGLP